MLAFRLLHAVKYQLCRGFSGMDKFVTILT